MKLLLISYVILLLILSRLADASVEYHIYCDGSEKTRQEYSVDEGTPTSRTDEAVEARVKELEEFHDKEWDNQIKCYYEKEEE